MINICSQSKNNLVLHCIQTEEQGIFTPDSLLFLLLLLNSLLSLPMLSLLLYWSSQMHETENNATIQLQASCLLLSHYSSDLRIFTALLGLLWNSLFSDFPSFMEHLLKRMTSKMPCCTQSKFSGQRKTLALDKKGCKCPNVGKHQSQSTEQKEMYLWPSTKKIVSRTRIRSVSAKLHIYMGRISK